MHKCYMISLKMENLRSYLQEAVEKMGIPKVISCKSVHHSQAVTIVNHVFLSSYTILLKVLGHPF